MFLRLFVTVDAGCRGVIFDRFQGVKQTVSGEGTHFLIPLIQKPIIFDCKARPRNIPVVTGSKGIGFSRGKFPFEMWNNFFECLHSRFAKCQYHSSYFVPT